MTKRLRHALLVQLVDGPTGAEQEAAIRSLARNGASLSSVLRAILLREAGRADLDVPVDDRMPRPCSSFEATTMRPDRCVCGAARAAHLEGDAEDRTSRTDRPRPDPFARRRGERRPAQRRTRPRR